MAYMSVMKFWLFFSFQRNTQERDGGAEAQELTEEAMKKKALCIVDEYLNIRNVKVGETGSMMFLLFLSSPGCILFL